MKLKPILIAIALMLYHPMHGASHKNPNLAIPQPWFTGPLIAQSATVVTLGHTNFEPYIFATDNCAIYNNHWKSVNQSDFWSINSPLPLWVGLASFADLIVQPTVMWNRTQNASSWAFGDLTAGLEFQALWGANSPGKWWPSIKLAIWEIFPTGKYRKSPFHKKLTDLGGMGAYTTQFWFMAGNVEHVYGDHFFRWELNASYTVSSRVHVKGFNAYGGGFGTDGTVTPNRIFEFDLGMEYSLTQNWALAMDVGGSLKNSAHFHGTPGVTASGAIASNAPPASAQFSIAPAIEYNFSANLGLIAGVWMTVAGRNSTKFYSGSIALNYYR